ncbi:UMP kinase [Candidatus Woesearchaeota archaeon]|nr:UMP kinase [Candidatus Woesearchaeota archaeon]
MTNEWVVVSLGGSLIVPPEGIATDFLKRFSELLHTLINEGYRFVLVTGGGATARSYQEAARDVTELSAEDLDWLGIHSTRLNAHLIRTVLRDIAYPRIITNPQDDILPDDALVLVGAGWKPGWSTDYDAAMLAQRLGAKRMVNLSNIEYVHAEDPHEHPNAKRWERMSWHELRGVIGNEWSPGLHAPFDPIAAKLCETAGIEVAILSADDFENVGKALRGQPFKGTVVKD